MLFYARLLLINNFDFQFASIASRESHYASDHKRPTIGAVEARLSKLEERLKLLENIICPGMSVSMSSENGQFQSNVGIAKTSESPNPESVVDNGEIDQEKVVKVEILEI